MMIDDELKYYTKQLARYERNLASLSWNFWRGVIYGFGFFIGSAILAAVLIYVLSKIQGWAYIGDVIKQIIEITGNT